MTIKKVEVFTSGCPVCEPVVKLVKQTACPSCEVIIYDLNKGCVTNECRDKAKEYGIKQVPAVAVNGKLLECCQGGTVSEEALRAAGIGAAAQYVRCRGDTRRRMIEYPVSLFHKW